MKHFRLKKNEKGFTLIELILVIVILGILAAVAIPRFVDLEQDARDATVAGVGAAISSAITLLHAQYLLDRGQTYNAGQVIAAVDTNEQVTLTTNAGPPVTITATINGVGSMWNYTEQAGVASGRLVGPPVPVP